MTTPTTNTAKNKAASVKDAARSKIVEMAELESQTRIMTLISRVTCQMDIIEEAEDIIKSRKDDIKAEEAKLVKTIKQLTSV